MIWIKTEKRLSINTLESYKSDLKFFIFFWEKYNNKDLNLHDFKSIQKDDITAWFFNRIELEFHTEVMQDPCPQLKIL